MWWKAISIAWNIGRLLLKDQGKLKKTNKWERRTAAADAAQDILRSWGR